MIKSSKKNLEHLMIQQMEYNKTIIKSFIL